MMRTRSAPKRSFNEHLLLAVEIPAVIGLIVMMIHVVANALARAVLHEPIYGTLEVTQFWYLPIIVLLGIVAAQARNEHIFADLLFDAFPPFAKRVTTVVVDLVTAVISILFAIFGMKEALHSLELGVTAGNTSLQVWPPQLLLVLAFAVMAVQLFYAAFRVARYGFEDQQDVMEDERFMGIDERKSVEK